MIDWIVAGRYRVHALLLGYFCVHVLVRTWVSSSLSFDESEQVFLSQWIHLGYNSQPPLYTWMQAGLFSLFGYSVFPVALLKNVILLLTYLAVFAFVRRGTRNDILAVAASIGMLTVPQVAWESHRDLSHTVLVTLATAMLFLCVVCLRNKPTTWMYAALGATCGVGMLSKYNFAISIIAVIVAAWTLTPYRKRLMDKRLTLSVVIAAVMMAPHAFWAVSNAGLATGKTVGQLTSAEPITWTECVWRGGSDLIGSYVACCAVSVVIFAICFAEHLRRFVALSVSRTGTRTAASEIAAPPEGSLESRELLLLVERFLLCVFSMLVLMVFSGYAITIKNHWLHPIVFLLPTYSILKLSDWGGIQRKQVSRLCYASFALGVLVIAMTVAKPITAGFRDRYSWLNMPYATMASEVKDQLDEIPSVIFVDDMRTAGNLKLQFPSSRILARDNRHLDFALPQNDRIFLSVMDKNPDWALEAMNGFLSERMPKTDTDFDPHDLQWKRVSVPYHYSQSGAQQEFFVAEIGRQRIAENKSSGSADVRR